MLNAILRALMALVVILVFFGLIGFGAYSGVNIIIEQANGTVAILVGLILIWKSHYLFFYLCKVISHIIVAFCYKVSIDNRKHLLDALGTKKAFILAPSHFTFLDGVFLYYMMPWSPRPIRFAAWYSYYYLFFPVMWLIGCIPMAGKSVSKNILKRANAKIIGLLSKKRTLSVVGVFPEGALNTSHTHLGLIKKGIEYWVKLLKKEKNTAVGVLPVGLYIKNSYFGRTWNEQFECPKPVQINIGTLLFNCTTSELSASLSELTKLKQHPDQI